MPAMPVLQQGQQTDSTVCLEGMCCGVDKRHGQGRASAANCKWHRLAISDCQRMLTHQALASTKHLTLPGLAAVNNSVKLGYRGGPRRTRKVEVVARGLQLFVIAGHDGHMVDAGGVSPSRAARWRFTTVPITACARVPVKSPRSKTRDTQGFPARVTAWEARPSQKHVVECLPARAHGRQPAAEANSHFRPC